MRMFLGVFPARFVRSATQTLLCDCRLFSLAPIFEGSVASYPMLTWNLHAAIDRDEELGDEESERR